MIKIKFKATQWFALTLNSEVVAIFQVTPEDSELNERVEQAINEHVDCDCKINGEYSIDEFLRIINVTVSISQDGDPEYKESFKLQPVYHY